MRGRRRHCQQCTWMIVGTRPNDQKKKDDMDRARGEGIHLGEGVDRRWFRDCNKAQRWVKVKPAEENKEDENQGLENDVAFLFSLFPPPHFFSLFVLSLLFRNHK